MRIGVVGSGITGLAAAHSLQASGYQVTVFESHKELGGLAGAVQVGGALIDRRCSPRAPARRVVTFETEA